MVKNSILLWAKKYANLLVILIVIAEYAALYFAITAAYLGIGVQLLFAIASLFFAGAIIIIIKGFKPFLVFYTVGSKKGLHFIESIAKKSPQLWRLMAQWGIVMGFGILSYPLLKGKINKKVYVIGIISVVLMTHFVIPQLINTIQFVHIPQLQNAAASVPSSSTSTTTSPIFYVLDAISAVAGLSGYIMSELILNAALIISGVAVFLSTSIAGHAQSSALTSQLPGVAPIIPGIDIPLVTGIMALAVLLIIHEFSHGVLAKIFKVRLKSIGLLIFGVIPIGAFVEPDENMVKKLSDKQQTEIFSAGISSNLIAALLFLIPMYLLMMYVVPNLYVTSANLTILSTVPNYPAYGVLQPGMQVLAWNNQTVSNVTSLSTASAKDIPGSKVTVKTNKGTYNFTAVKSPSNSSRGLIGVNIAKEQQVAGTAYAKTMFFIYTFVSLSFLLNFAVGVVNLLPIPSLDGWRIYNANIKNKKIINAFVIILVVSILLNFLPLLFYYL